MGSVPSISPYPGQQEGIADGKAEGLSLPFSLKPVADLGSKTANCSVSQGGNEGVSVGNSVLNFYVIV